MNIDRIDLNLLVVLETIYSEGGITRASEKLHLTQPAVSHSLARLRQLLDDPLFIRKGRQMVPTPKVRNMMGPLRQALRSISLTLNDADHFDPEVQTREFAVGVRNVTELTLMPELMTRVYENTPRIGINAVPLERGQLESDLASGALDAAIDILLPVGPAVSRQKPDQIPVGLAPAAPH